MGASARRDIGPHQRAGSAPVIRTRLPMAIIGGLLVLSVLLQLLGAQGGGGGPGRSGPLDDTGRLGLAAFGTLLERSGVDVRRGAEPLIETLDRVDGVTAVMVVDRFLDGDEQAAVLRRAETGRVVVVGVTTALGIDVGSDPVTMTDLRGVNDADRLGGARQLAVEGQAWGAVRSGFEILAGDDTGAVIVERRADADADADAGVAPSGAALVGVSSSSMLSNGLLATRDNAAAAIALAGGAARLVVYDGVPGGDGSTGFAALPWRARWFLAGLCLAIGVAAFSFGRRNGPAELPHRELAPPRTAYIDALGRLIERSTGRRRGRRARRSAPSRAPAPSSTASSSPPEGTPHQ